MKSVYCAVRTGSLNEAAWRFVFKGLKAQSVKMCRWTPRSPDFLIKERNWQRVFSEYSVRVIVPKLQRHMPFNHNGRCINLTTASVVKQSSCPSAHCWLSSILSHTPSTLIQGWLCNNAECSEHSSKLLVTARCKWQIWVFQLIASFSVGKRSYCPLKCTQVKCKTTTSV